VHAAADPNRAVEALLAFWAEAGVDACYEDEPVDRTVRAATPAPRPALAAVSPVARPGPDVSTAIAKARETAAACETLDALRDAIAAFDGFGLTRAGAKQAVFARGNPRGRLMVIGEAPGADEDLHGEPFVGRSGRLLDRMLKAAGLYETAFVTNTVFWRPPGNGQPSPQDQAVCRPFLERAIALISPQIVLPVGGASAKFLLAREEGILSLRGRWAEFSTEDGAITIATLPTLHPAFLLRNPLAKKKAWADLMEVSHRLGAA
jgi:DNA polymerase